MRLVPGMPNGNEKLEPVRLIFLVCFQSRMQRRLCAFMASSFPLLLVDSIATTTYSLEPNTL